MWFASPRRALARAPTIALLPLSLAAALTACGPAAGPGDTGADADADTGFDGGVSPDPEDAGAASSGLDDAGGAGTGGGVGTPVDEDAGPGEPVLSPLFEGSFTGSNAWNGANVLYAVLRAEPNTAGHDHVVRSPNFSGSLSYRVGDLSACSVNVTVPVSALLPDEDGMRADLDMPAVDWTWSAGGGREAVKTNMLAENQLHAVRHPDIRFVSTACRGAASTVGALQVDGNLTLRGVTRPVTWNVQFTASDSRVVAQGTLTIRQSNFGFSPYFSEVFGIVFQNADPVDLHFEISVDD